MLYKVNKTNLYKTQKSARGGQKGIDKNSIRLL